ncbi:alpha/beta hydrolase [Streptococcus equinus]|uniref:alpha/beta hydrolase n=1 Tax=Streptococcus equinus TaxID=1335 RepID=UPI00041C12E0|nr:alpha/beta hydrolase [Streptococcus equinus]
MKKLKKFLLYFLVCLAALLALGLGFIRHKTYQAHKSSMAAAKSAKITKDYLFFESKESTKANIVFYQGALVEEKAYAGLAKDLSKSGYGVYILKTPLNLPVLSSQKALSIIKAKKLKNVYLAGHSLGGVVACMNANSAKSDNISGLILLASYPSEKVNLSKRHLKVLSITASNDKVLKWDQYKSAKKRLPSDTTYLSISGGNHSEFGDYGHQSKDGDATISQKNQEKQIAAAVSNFIN